jgi:hypothetical protein
MWMLIQFPELPFDGFDYEKESAKLKGDADLA